MDISNINYVFRRSKRAKRISLRIIPDKGLEIVLPQRTSQREGLRFLHAHEDWVLKHMQQQQQTEPQPHNYPLLNEFDLQCIQQKVQICYTSQHENKIRLRQPLADVIIISGPVKDARCCQPYLDHWLKQTALQPLSALLSEFSNETGLIYKECSIRIQKTRWGSCSSQGDISLNARLLLLPLEIVRYVLIHELCHLKEMNHSKRFWRLVASFVPNYQQLKQQLKRY